jgi:hypothetical protein
MPLDDAGRVIWAGNFKTKLPLYASAVGITATEVTNTNNDYAMYKYVMDLLEVYKQITHNIVAYKDLLKHVNGQQHLGAIPTLPVLAAPPVAVSEGMFDRIRGIVKRIKGHPAYTNAMGEDLGIIAPNQTTNQESMQPLLAISLDAGRPNIKCLKGDADAIDLYVDRKDGSGFVLIGRLLKLDYIDIAPLPAAALVQEWDYKAIYVIGNNQVGLMSTVASVVVKQL